MSTKELRSFAHSKVFSSLKERADQGEFDRSLWKDMADLGLMGAVIDKEYGGEGGNVQDFAESAAILAGEGLDLGLTLSLVDHVMLCAYPLKRFASEVLKERFLPRLCQGGLVGAAAISEPATGGNPSHMRTTAQKEDGGYILKGEKGPVTNAPVADVFMVIASTDPQAGKEGLSAFLVEKEEKVTVDRIDLDFLPTSPHGIVSFDGTWVPHDHLVGEEGWGHKRISRSVFLWERAVIIPVVIGFMERWHHMVVSGYNPADIPPDARVLLAQRKVELTAYNVLSRHLLKLTFDSQEGGRERMELLLFFGKSLPTWVDSMRRLVEGSNFPMDDTMNHMLQDLRLLEVGRGILDWQFQKLLF